MDFQKFAPTKTNINANILGNDSVGIRQGSTCSSAEVNGAIRQNSIVAYALVKALGASSLGYDTEYNVIYNDDDKNTNNPIYKGLKEYIESTDAAVKYYNSSTGKKNINDKFVSIEDRLSALGFKQATLTIYDGNYISSINGYQQGKIVAIQFNIKFPTSPTGGVNKSIGQILNVDAPTQDIVLGSQIKKQSNYTIKATYTWKTDNTIQVQTVSVATGELGTVNNNKLICVRNISSNSSIYTTN